MKILCTYCAGRKRPGSRPLPAIRRYLSPRIAVLHREARRRGSAWAFRIVSGRYGLLAPETPLPWYDHLLREDEVRPTLDRAEVLAQAPSVEDDRFRVPPALGQEP